MGMERIRFKVEEDIVRMTIVALLRNGYSVTYNDGEEDVLTEYADSRPESELTHDADAMKTDLMLAAMQCVIDGRRCWAVDDCWLYCRTKSDAPAGWVRFVYGNDGWDVMADYTTNLEEVLKEVNAYADSLS